MNINQHFYNSVAILCNSGKKCWFFCYIVVKLINDGKNGGYSYGKSFGGTICDENGC